MPYRPTGTSLLSYTGNLEKKALQMMGDANEPLGSSYILFTLMKRNSKINM